MSTVGHGIWQENENHGKWEIHTLGSEIWQGKLKKGGKFRILHCRTRNMAKNWKSWKMWKSTWRLEKWRNHWKTWKMRNAYCRTCYMARKLKITENEKYTLYFRTWNMARKTEKGGKFWNVRCRTWNMARKLKIMENEKHPPDDLKNDEITD